MRPRDFKGSIQPMRVAVLSRYIRYIESVGAPVERLLARSGIPAVLLETPMALVPQESATRFIDLACRCLGTEHLGVQVSLALKLDNLGPYGQMLQNALTLHEYLRKGVGFYDAMVTGQRIWLSEHGEELRFNVANLNQPGAIAYQPEMETLVPSIERCKDAAGPDWSPREISIGHRTRTPLPDVELFDGSRIVSGTGETYFTLPRTLLERRFPEVGDREQATGNCGCGLKHPLPNDLGGMVRVQIESFLRQGTYQVKAIAESLAMSKRSFQRLLAEQGLSYSQMLGEARQHLAVDWLETTDKPIGEIAFDLGYSDSSNFSRAFRRQVGIAPQVFRENGENGSP
jgi:AraC-like DNA-binding protein